EEELRAGGWEGGEGRAAGALKEWRRRAAPPSAADGVHRTGPASLGGLGDAGRALHQQLLAVPRGRHHRGRDAPSGPRAPGPPGVDLRAGLAYAHRGSTLGVPLSVGARADVPRVLPRAARLTAA